MKWVLLLLAIAGCTSVYVQTGNGRLESSSNIEKSGRVGRSSTTTEIQPKKEKDDGSDIDPRPDL
jgi:hypothetical protein